MKYLLIGFLKAWRLMISPLYGDVCRYYPSCSAYALRAVQHHGAVKGSWYAARRLLRCHPWAPGGYDPVPGTPEFDEEMRQVRRTAATMGRDSSRLPDSSGGTDTSGSVSAQPDRLEARDQLPHRHRIQGRAVTVAEVRGAK